MARQERYIVHRTEPANAGITRGHGGAVIPYFVLMVSVAEAAGAPTGIERFTLANGLSVTIYSADYLKQRLTTIYDKPAIRLDDGRAIFVITDITDKSIVNKGNGRFHSIPHQFVVRELQAIRHPNLNMSVSVYILPYPRRSEPWSATVGTEILLSPHVLPVDTATSAYIVAHEMGHAFHNSFLPDDEESDDWKIYRQLRGIADLGKFSASGRHAYRPKEIFAEDFRVLYGSAHARFGGHVENTELSNPELFPDLAQFFLDVATEPSS